jgi:nitroreductase
MDSFLAIVSKREVRDFADREVPEDVKLRILEAGRVAGSSANKQQRFFVVIESEEGKRRAAEAVYTPANITGCAFAVAIAVFGKGPIAFDAGRAAQNMILAAWNDGVGSTPNGMPDRGAAAHALGLVPGEEPAIIVSFGYPARPVDPESRSPEEWIDAADRNPFGDMVRTI